MVSSITFRAQTPVNQCENKENIKVGNSFGGSLAALTAGGAIHLFGPLTVATPISNGMARYGNLPKQDGEVMKKAVLQMVKDNGLKEKGVRVKFLEPLYKLKKHNMRAGVKNIDPSEKFYRWFYDTLIIDSVREGENAFFVPTGAKLPKVGATKYKELAAQGSKKIKETAYYIKPNSVVLSKNRLFTAGFHEVGHAMNYNLSTVGKFLQKCRPISILAPVVLGIYGAISKKSKPNGENQELTSAQKTNNFIRDNAGKLTFAAALPMLIEEAMATVKGQKYANKVLKPDLAKKVLKGNAVAYCSYLAVALLGSLGVATAVKIKDNAMEKKEYKALLKAQIAAQEA